MGWSSLLKATLRLGGKAVKATASTTGKAVLHPQQTIKGIGTAGKTLAVGGAATYIGWEKLTTDKSVARIVGDAIIGSDNIDAIKGEVDGVTESISDLKESVGGAVDTMTGAVSSVDSKWGGMSNFLRGMFSGNGGTMFGNFFSNLGNGNVSGLSIAGLVVSAMLVFGRFGWLGKIAGAVLAMMTIGNNASMSQLLGGGQSQQSQPEAKRENNSSPTVQSQPQPKIEAPQEEREVIHRGR